MCLFSSVCSLYIARAIPATARRPAATDPTFFVAAPWKLLLDGDVPEPVFEGATGAIGDPVATEPEPEPAPPDGDDVPVATGAVPVRKPVEPATTDELRKRSAKHSSENLEIISSYL